MPYETDFVPKLKPEWEVWVLKGDDPVHCSCGGKGCMMCCPCEDCQLERRQSAELEPEALAEELADE